MAQVKNNRTLWLIPSIALALIGIGSFIFAQVDSTGKIEAHDSSATAHPDLRKMIESNQQALRFLQKSVDSLLIEQRNFGERYEKDTKEIKKLLKDLRDQG